MTQRKQSCTSCREADLSTLCAKSESEQQAAWGQAVSRSLVWGLPNKAGPSTAQGSFRCSLLRMILQSSCSGAAKVNCSRAMAADFDVHGELTLRAPTTSQQSRPRRPSSQRFQLTCIRMLAAHRGNDRDRKLFHTGARKRPHRQHSNRLAAWKQTRLAGIKMSAARRC